MGSIKSRENAPVSWRLTPAGFVNGRNMLKIVLVPSSARVGITCAMAGWCIGGHHETNARFGKRSFDDLRVDIDMTLMPIWVSASRQPRPI